MSKKSGMREFTSDEHMKPKETLEAGAILSPLAHVAGAAAVVMSDASPSFFSYSSAAIAAASSFLAFKWLYEGEVPAGDPPKKERSKAMSVTGFGIGAAAVANTALLYEASGHNLWPATAGAAASSLMSVIYGIRCAGTLAADAIINKSHQYHNEVTAKRAQREEEKSRPGIAETREKGPLEIGSSFYKSAVIGIAAAIGHRRLKRKSSGGGSGD